MTKISQKDHIHNNRYSGSGPSDITHLKQMADEAIQIIKPLLQSKKRYLKQHPEKQWLQKELDTWIEYLEAQNKTIDQFSAAYVRLSNENQQLRKELKHTQRRADRLWLQASKAAVTLTKFSMSTADTVSSLKNQ